VKRRPSILIGTVIALACGVPTATGASTTAIARSSSAFTSNGSADAGPTTERGYITVRDGTQLQFTLQRPARPGRFPTLLNFAGYNSGSNVESSAPPIADDLLAEGFAIIGVNVRGSGCSGGAFEVFDPRWALDGYDVIEWIAHQRWSTGKVGMFGASFPGILQLQVAATRPPHLRAIAPLSTLGDTYRDISHPGGIPNVVFPYAWLGLQNQDSTSAALTGVQQGDTDCARNFTLSTAENPPNSVPMQYVRHPFDDSWMVDHSPGRGLRSITAAALVFTQWQDEQVGGRVAGDLGQLRRDRTWIIGSNGNHPWGYCASCKDLQKRFFRWALKGQGASFTKVPHYQLWMESTNLNLPGGATGHRSWTIAPSSWPPATRAEAWSLASDGRLLPGAASVEGSSAYAYPGPSASRSNPVADVSGGNATDAWEDSVPPGAAGLTFTTAPFPRDKVVYSAAAELWLASTATDTDLQVTLTEIRPDGQEMFIQRGWLRASHRVEDPRRSSPLRPYQTHQERDARPLVPGSPVLLRVEVFPFSHAIRAGSSLRLIIDAPSGQTGFWGFDYLRTPAMNTILHDRAHRSRLLVGVLPGEVARAALPPCGTLQNQPCRPVRATP